MYSSVVEYQVEKTPDTVAVSFEEKQLTYRELNKHANKIAHYLQTLNVGPEVMVGICLSDRWIWSLAPRHSQSWWRICAIGSSISPERLAFMIEDHKCQCY